MEGNKKVGAWLAAGQSIGELKGLKLSNLAIMTEPKKDFVDLQFARTKKAYPHATSAQLEKFRAAFVNQGQAVLAKDPYGLTARDLHTTYIPTNSSLYGSEKTIGENQYNIIGAGVLGHERYHLNNSDDEEPAYREEVRVLERFNPDATQTHVKDRINFIKNEKLKQK